MDYEIPSGRATVDQDTFLRLCRSRDFLAAGFHHRVNLQSAAGAACLSPFPYTDCSPEPSAKRLTASCAAFASIAPRRLLASSDASVTEVCLAVGYDSLGSFSTLFRSRMGCSPLEYRRSLRRIFPVPELAVYRFIATCFLQPFGLRPF